MSKTSREKCRQVGLLAGLLVSFGLLAACGGGPEVDCGEGTSLEDGTCIIESSGCGPGTVLKNGACQPAGAACGEGTMLDSGECVPTQTASCGMGTMLDQATGECVPTETVSCGSGTELDGGECVLTDAAKDKSDACQNGLVWDSQQGRCKLAEANCGEGTQLAMSGKCVKSDMICGKNTVFDSDTGSCIATDAACAGDTTFNKEVGGCVSGNIITSSCQSPMVLSQTEITADTTLPAGNCYEVANQITIKDDATLTIGEGARLAFQDDAGLTVDGDGAALSAVGTEMKPVTFTGAKQNRGHWSGITFDSASADNELTHVVVEYAGESSSSAVFVRDESEAGIQNTTIRENAGVGLEVLGNCCGDEEAVNRSGKLRSFSDNTITSNAGPAVKMPAWSVDELDTGSTYQPNDNDGIVINADNRGYNTVLDTVAWPDFGVPYLVENGLVVSGSDSGWSGSLTIEAGVTVKFAQSTGLTIERGGALEVKGTSNSPVKLTGMNQTAGFWKGVSFFDSEGGENKLLYTTIEYAGDSRNAGLEVRELAEVTVQNSTFQHNKGFGIELQPDCCGESVTVNGTGSVRSFQNNTLTDNSEGPIKLMPWSVDSLDTASTYKPNGKDRVLVRNGTTGYRTILGTVKWRDLGVPYEVTGTIDVSAQSSNWQGLLEIEAGVTVQFQQASGLNVYGDGALNIKGTKSSPVTLTGTRQIKGWWRGVYFNDTNNILNRLEHTTISYGGNVAWDDVDNAANLTVYEPDGLYTPRMPSEATRLALNNVTLSNSAGAGLYLLDTNENDGTVESIELTSCSNVSFSGNMTKVDSKEADETSNYSAACGAP